MADMNLPDLATLPEAAADNGEPDIPDLPERFRVVFDATHEIQLATRVLRRHVVEESDEFSLFTRGVLWRISRLSDAIFGLLSEAELDKDGAALERYRALVAAMPGKILGAEPE